MNLLARVAEAAIGSDGRLRSRVFERWNFLLTSAWRRVERSAFRRELRYTVRELRDRGRRAGFQGLLVYRGRRPVAVMMVYTGSSPGTLYFDTMAVFTPGTGLGSRFLTALIGESGRAGLRRIELDTEEVSERGQELVNWYRRFGFRVVLEEDDGNVKMVADLTPGV